MKIDALATVDLSVTDFHRIREHLRRHTGVHFEEAKITLFRSRLAKRLRTLRLNDYSEYADFLIRQDPEAVELRIALNLVTTNLTAFFREAHHFEYLAQMLVPEIIATKRRDRTIHIWSCACSTGAESYTAAIVLREALEAHPEWQVKILASDINTDVLEQAERGIYSAEEVRGVPEALLRRHFQRGSGQHAGRYRIRPETRRLVNYCQLNLLRPWPGFLTPFDAIFCRNVLIYFSAQDQQQVVSGFAAELRPGGVLFLGHSENVPAGQTFFERLPKTVYRRTTTGGAIHVR